MHGFDLLPSVEGGIAFKEVHLDEGRTRDRQEFGLDLVARVLRHKGKAYSHNIVERPNSSRIRHKRWKAVYLKGVEGVYHYARQHSCDHFHLLSAE